MMEFVIPCWWDVLNQHALAQDRSGYMEDSFMGSYSVIRWIHGTNMTVPSTSTARIGIEVIFKPIFGNES
jgi:hypothetical protein